MDEVRVGKILNTHGVRGEVKVLPLTDEASRFEELHALRVVLENEKSLFHITSVRYHKNLVLLKFKEINSREEAIPWKEAYLCISKEERRALKEDQYFISDLVGLDVFCENEFLGTLTEVLQPGANDVYVIKRPTGEEIYFPALKATVQNVDLREGRMDVVVPDGLLESGGK